MSSGSKIAIIVVGIVVGLPILACGGCLTTAMIFAPSDEERAEMRKEAEERRERIRTENAEHRLKQEAIETEERNRPQMNAERYAQVKPGMTYDQVVEIVGPPDQELSRGEQAGHVTVMYQWEAGFGSNANMLFQNGKLVNKAQFGL